MVYIRDSHETQSRAWWLRLIQCSELREGTGPRVSKGGGGWQDTGDKKSRCLVIRCLLCHTDWSF